MGLHVWSPEKLRLYCGGRIIYFNPCDVCGEKLTTKQRAVFFIQTNVYFKCAHAYSLKINDALCECVCVHVCVCVSVRVIEFRLKVQTIIAATRTPAADRNLCISATIRTWWNQTVEIKLKYTTTYVRVCTLHHRRLIFSLKKIKRGAQ